MTNIGAKIGLSCETLKNWGEKPMPEKSKYFISPLLEVDEVRKALDEVSATAPMRMEKVAQ